MREGGLEPPNLAAPDPKSGVSANSTTPAWEATCVEHSTLQDLFGEFNCLVGVAMLQIGHQGALSTRCLFTQFSACFDFIKRSRAYIMPCCLAISTVVSKV